MSTTLETGKGQKSNGLATYLGIVVSPASACAQLARTPTWGWAAIAGIIISLAAIFVALPESHKIADLARQAQLAQMTAAQQEAVRERMGQFSLLFVIFAAVGGVIGPWIGWLIAAVLFFVAAVISGAVAKFLPAWVASVNAFAIAALAQLVNSVILALRGADAITSQQDAYALPSLAMFVHSSPKLAAILYSYNVINVWYFVVIVIALMAIMKMSRGAAIATAVIYSLLGAGFGALSAR